MTKVHRGSLVGNPSTTPGFPPRRGEENQTNVNLAAYPRQPQIQGNNQNATASNNFHNNPTKLNLQAEERPNGVGKNIFDMYEHLHN